MFDVDPRFLLFDCWTVGTVGFFGFGFFFFLNEMLNTLGVFILMPRHEQR